MKWQKCGKTFLVTVTVSEQLQCSMHTTTHINLQGRFGFQDYTAD